jgi:hypothetical protein
MGEVASSTAPPKPSKRLTWFGIALTTIYLIAIGSIAVTHRETMLNLAPNEWGDFLAGTFGPVAFLWLVLGYFQQGDELRYSAEALWLQGEELKNSVEQQKALVEATREQVTFEKQNLESERAEFHKRSQPIFFVQYIGYTSETNRTFRHEISLENTGQDCSDVRLSINGDLVTRSPLLRRGEAIGGSESSAKPMNFDNARVDIIYTDINGNGGQQSFLLVDGEFQGISKYGQE